MRRLAKLAEVSARLRAGVKTAGLGSAMVDTAFRVARKSPGAALGAAATVGLGGVASVGSYKKSRTGFDPTVNKLMLGQTPVPPGAE